MLQTGIPLGRPISACRRCRKFKVGCDRAKPSCSRCAKAKVDCIYVSPPSSPSDVSTGMGVGHISSTLHDPIFGHDGVCIDEATTSKHTQGRETQAKPNESSLQNLSLYASSLRRGNASPPSVDLVGSGKQAGKLTRDRAILSCMRCRRHKVRCDRQIPCGRCIKNKRESQCVYSEAAVPVLGRIISEKHHETLNLIATSFIDSKWAATVRNGAHWNSLLYEMKNYLPPGHGQYSNLDLHHEKPISGMTPTINYPFSGDTLGPDSIARIIAQLPPQAVQQLFVSQYFDAVEKVYHLLDKDAFQRELQQFWADPSSKEDDWLAQYFVILCLGCQAVNYCAEESGKEAYHGLPPSFLRSAEICLKRTPYLLMASLENIRTLVLIVMSKQMYAMSCHEADTCWPLTGLIVRLSIRVGLHRVASQPYEQLSYEDRIKARIWVVVLMLEMRQSLVCGMPLLLRPVDISGTEVKRDPCTGSPIPQIDVQPTPVKSSEHSILVKVFASSSGLLFRAIELATCPNDSVQYSEVAEVDSSMRQHLYQSGIGLYNSHLGIDSTEEVDLELCMIQIFFRQILMALHGRFALQPNASTEYPVSYVSSLESALAVIAFQRDLCEGEKWVQLCAWFAGFFRHEFFTAAMTVCSQLVRDLEVTSMPSHASFCETQPQELMLDALQSCRDMWGKEKNWSVCNANAFALVDNLVRILRQAQEQDSTTT